MLLNHGDVWLCNQSAFDLNVLYTFKDVFLHNSKYLCLPLAWDPKTRSFSVRVCSCAIKEPRTYSLSPQVCEMVIHICMARFFSISEQGGLDQAVYSECYSPNHIWTSSGSVLAGVGQPCRGPCRQSNSREKRMPAFKPVTCLFSLLG